MNHFRDFADRFILNSESPDQRFERAIVPIMREIALQHVESEHACVQTKFVPKTNFAFGSMNLRISHAEPTRSISGRGQSEPDLVAKISPLELGLRFRPGLSFLKFPQDHPEIFRFGAVEKIGCSDLAKLFSNAIKPPVELDVRVGPRHERAQHFPKRRVFLRPGGIEQFD